MKLEKQIRSHKKCVGFGILLVLSILLYIQHRHVYMYFDDYGYGISILGGFHRILAEILLPDSAGCKSGMGRSVVVKHKSIEWKK